MPGFKIMGDGQGPNAVIEPHRAHRWRFNFAFILDLKDIELYALSCQRPTVEFDTIAMHSQQTQIHMPGKHRWNPINVQFYEVSDLRSARKIFNYWAGGIDAGSVLSFKTNTLTTDFRTNVVIALESGGGFNDHAYALFNTWPSKVEPSELNYASTDLTTVQVTLTYDSARQDFDNEALGQFQSSGVAPEPGFS